MSRSGSVRWTGASTVLVGMLIVAGCTGGSDGNGTPSATTPTTTVTDTVTGSTPASTDGSSTSPVGGPPSGSSGTPSAPGLCTPTVMTFAISRNDGAAGSTYFEIHATNGSPSPCVTTGFPGVAFLDANGRTILNATRGDATKATTITVAPGEEITAQVQAESTDIEQGGTPCPSSPKFLLTLPDNTDSTTITHTTPACRATVAAFVEGAGN